MKPTHNLFISLLMLLLTLPAMAAVDSRWSVYPVFASGHIEVLDTENSVYFINSGLFSYDKQEQEQHSYENVLNGSDIAHIFYNDEKDYLLVAYTNANVDLLLKDGSVINVAAIVNSNLTPCSINDAAFSGDNIYLATSFGIVKVDATTGEVIESGIYNKNVDNIAVISDYLVMQTDSYLHSIALSESIHSFNLFKQVVFTGSTTQILPISDSRILVRTRHKSEYALRIYKLDLPAGGCTGAINVASTIVPPFIKTPDKVCAVIEGKITSIDEDGNTSTLAVIPADYAEDVLDSATDPTALWCVNNQGITNVKFDLSGSATILADRFLPYAVYTKEVDFFAPSKSGSEVYIYNYGSSAYKPYSTTHESPLTATRLDLATDATEYATPYPVDAVGSTAQNFQNVGGRYPLNPTMIAVDPDDPDIYYLATGNDGIYKIKNGERVGYFNATNSPMRQLWGANAFGVHIDRGGNLWMVTYQGDGTSLSVLPAGMRNVPTSEVKIEDWIEIDDAGLAAATDVTFLECQRSPMIFVASHGASFQLLAYNTNSTYSNFNDDKAYLWTSMVDQDGKTWTPERRVTLIEDLNGYVWFGTNRGIYQITTPTSATSASMRFKKLKVPRNDGTNEADYLMDNDMVYSMSVDSKNCKWIATENSGLVCTNEAGSAILSTYTPVNSPLLTNQVLSVWVDRNNDNVYVGTLNGMMRYDAAVSSATESFDDILAYPNPVRHDYYGPVYVRGLMDNCMVKITDAQGGLIAQGRAENGTYRWDACDFSGKRVKTGVYYVIATTGGDSSTSATTKIMVVN